MEITEMFVLFFCLLMQLPGIHATNFTRRDLLEYLTNKTTYDLNYPPGYDEGNRTVVIVQLDIFDLTSISEQNMEYTIMMLMRMQWQDERLAFKELANYSRLDLTGEMVALVWTPDLYISNERKAGAHSLVKPEELIYINPDGVVTFSKRLSMTNFCRMNLMNYPFDVQRCGITIMSYAFTSDELMLQWADYSVQAKGLDLPNYDIAVESVTDGVLSNGQKSLAEGNFSTLTLTLKIERKARAYGSMYFAPYPVFFIIAMTSFGFKNKIGSRITVCTAGITTSVLQWIAIYSRLPPVWYLTHLDGWIISHVSIIGFLLVYHAFWYLYLHKFEELLKEVQEGRRTEQSIDNQNDREPIRDDVDNQNDREPKRDDVDNQNDREPIRDDVYNQNNSVPTCDDVEIRADKRYKVIGRERAEKYRTEFAKRLNSKTKFMKAIRKNLIEFLVFVLFTVGYTGLLSLLLIWSRSQDKVMWVYVLLPIIVFVIASCILFGCEYACMRRQRVIETFRTKVCALMYTRM
ncbi:glycine receptor subunit alpha-2-like isoform X2 [Mercenaria mercenaria]|uniref:glycine receptor subunit alpha-2-like isoform X2 n=1 Tax=Mercenaria mercenaria TaxID=6596 RepID=UPI00234F19CC|nr:glycine receptor subunit alpha-2-like isoform X2 [Mercenaria mercenaria]